MSDSKKEEEYFPAYWHLTEERSNEAAEIFIRDYEQIYKKQLDKNVTEVVL